jgi:hypothetical protein
MGAFDIYGLKFTTPAPPKVVSGSEFPRREQVFTRTEIPDSFLDVEFGDDGMPQYSEGQEEFIAQEFDRILNGYHFMCNGRAVYVTGLHYFYLNFWVLEDGHRPDYRDCDRRWFYYQKVCEDDPKCFGIIRIKKRREGASSQAAAAIVYKAITTEKANCGIVSKTGTPDARDVFQKMVVRGFRSLPIFLKPRTEDDNPKTQLVLSSPKDRRKKKDKHKGDIYDNDRGLESVIDYRNTALNSYDSGRVTIILIDEGGKFPKDVPISQYWGIVKKTLQRGAIRVGFALMPSTVNDANNGGDEFKLLWDSSDNIAGTSTGLYRYFCPAYDGYEGFIGRYGESIIEKPTKEQKDFIKDRWGMDIDMGAKEFLEAERSKHVDPMQLSEEIRMNPFSEDEAFLINSKRCYFNSHNIYEQMDFITEKKIPIRRVSLVWRDSKTVDWVDSKDGDWHVYEFPKIPCMSSEIHGLRTPSNTELYSMGIDPFRSSVISGKGSMGAAYIFKKLDMSDPNNSGMPVAEYVGRPRLKSLFHDEMLKAAILWGCQASYENDVGDDFVDYFRDKGMIKYLSKTPDAAIDPQKRKRSKSSYGVASRDPFAMARQLEVCISYVELHSEKVYFYDLLKELLTYDHENRTKFDRTVAFMISLLSGMSVTNKFEENKPSVRLPIKTYTLRY